MGGMQEIVPDMYDISAETSVMTPQDTLVKAAKLGREGSVN